MCLCIKEPPFLGGSFWHLKYLSLSMQLYEHDYDPFLLRHLTLLN